MSDVSQQVIAAQVADRIYGERNPHGWQHLTDTRMRNIVEAVTPLIVAAERRRIRIEGAE